MLRVRSHPGPGPASTAVEGGPGEGAWAWRATDDLVQAKTVSLSGWRLLKEESNKGVSTPWETSAFAFPQACLSLSGC